MNAAKKANLQMMTEAYVLHHDQMQRTEQARESAELAKERAELARESAEKERQRTEIERQKLIKGYLSLKAMQNIEIS